MAKNSLSATRSSNYAEWYQQVIKAAALADNAPVRGCMVIKPWGFAIWERLQAAFDKRFKETGHVNAYFPLFIPLRFIEKEAQHVEGFAKEMAVVTHHRLCMKDGKLVPDAPLEEPLIVRPTSETIIGEMMAEWIQSYRDLPLLLNQWCNIVRWEMRPRIFLRTSEFLWQEGHTAHATQEEAEQETMQMLGIYKEVVEGLLALPIIAGEKPESERFPGAVRTFCIEGMMQDGKALQAGTSHYLGQNFAKAANIRFQTKAGGHDYVHTTSWGVSTRLIGGLIMTHADDVGLCLPPRLSPQQVVIVPILRDDDTQTKVLAYCEALRAALQAQSFAAEGLRVHLDARDMPAVDKKWEWVRKGVPMVLEIGPRDVEKDSVAVLQRNKIEEKPTFLGRSEFINGVTAALEDIQNAMFCKAQAYQAQRMRSDIAELGAFKEYFSGAGDESYNDGKGFVQAPWCGDNDSEAVLKELGVTIRCLPLDAPPVHGACVLTRRPAKYWAIFARSY